jgi:apolipoprotein N-acyltransferase
MDRAGHGAGAAGRDGIFGGVRLALQPTALVAKVKLRIMQPNLQQDVKFNYAAKAEVMQKYLALSDRASGPQSTGVRDTSILIWPESAFPFFLTREADAMAQIADLLPKGTILITGSVRAPDLPPGVRISRAYNSIYVIDHDGSVLSVYDKVHLVPFGEYLPLQDWMEKLGFVQLTRVQGGFIAGTRRRPMEVPGAPRMLPLICYEAIFPGDVAARDDRAGWMINLTMMAGSEIQPGPISTCSRHASARSSRDCPWFVQPTPESPLSLIPSDGLSRGSASASRAYWMPACPPPSRRRFTPVSAILPPRSWLPPACSSCFVVVS